jgi:hypothetical protein
LFSTLVSLGKGEKDSALTRPLPFLPGTLLEKPSLLTRYLPPIPNGVLTQWLRANLLDPTQGWVLDPFGAAPVQAIEAARAGYRVLVAANNPITRFLLDFTSRAPRESLLRAALAELAAAHKGDERIEPHIRSLYASECNRCNQPVMVDAFLWERGAAAPFGKLYTCPHCHFDSKNNGGEMPTNAADAERAAQFAANRGLHHARALERVAPLNDPNRPHVEEALEVYLPRAVYALITLINKSNTLKLPADQQDALTALLLSACNAGNTLWAYPSGRERPLQLVSPPRFRENNLWLALEEAVHTWASDEAPISITGWPDMPPTDTGGICIFEGRLKHLADELPKLKIGAVAAAFPRPNQAFWTLCALWAGWLWGHEAIGPFGNVLQRRRYDWAWHTTALSAALGSLAEKLPEATPFFGLLSPVESGFLSAAIIAANTSGFDLQGMAVGDEQALAELTWLRGMDGVVNCNSFERIHRFGLEAAITYLRDRGEPADHLHLTAAALAGMSKQSCFRSRQGERATQPTPAEYYTQTQNALREVLTYRGGFLRYNAGEALESGQWWLRQTPESVMPLADRVEKAAVNYLITHAQPSFADLENALCEEFTGLLTPENQLLRLCLASYAEEVAPDRWKLRPAEQPTTRRADLTAAQAALTQLAAHLGLRAEDPSPLRWLDPQGATNYWFHLKASAMLSNVLLQPESPPSQTFIVVPGSRANLIVYKLNRDPRLQQAVQQGVRFIKFRHLRALLERPPNALTLENIAAQLDADPLTDSASQMRLF